MASFRFDCDGAEDFVANARGFAPPAPPRECESRERVDKGVDLRRDVLELDVLQVASEFDGRGARLEDETHVWHAGVHDVHHQLRAAQVRQFPLARLGLEPRGGDAERVRPRRRVQLQTGRLEDFVPRRLDQLFTRPPEGHAEQRE